MLKGIIQRLVGVLGLTLAGFGVWYCGGKVDDSDHVTFLRLDPAALDAAFAAKKPVVIYTTSPSDSACQTQDNGALKDPRVIAALAPFVRFKLVASPQAARMNQIFAEQMGVEGNAFALPMFHFMSASGAETAKLLGVQTADALIAAAAKAQKP
jgi:thiol:disulfide interchange protein